jgi:hypothetical protein
LRQFFRAQSLLPIKRQHALPTCLAEVVRPAHLQDPAV